jgi:hypothetical protein
MAIDTTAPSSRRALLAGALGALAATVAGGLGRPAAVQAHDVDDIRLGGNNLATYTTTITNQTAHLDVLDLRATGRGSAILASSEEDSAIRGNGVNGAGVEGTSFTLEGVVGLSVSGVGVSGRSEHNGVSSVYGSKIAATGPSILGENTEPTNGYAAVYGLTNGSGPGLLGENTKAGNGASGVARGTGSGVYGQSDNGRGGTFVGKKAQIRLNPSAAVTHPTTGYKGDLFVDTSGRLWFCKGGTNWVQLA